MLQAHDIAVMRGLRQVLGPVSISLAPGEVLGVLGANGAGKSTLLCALAGELAARSGKVTLDGQALSAWTPARQARRRAVLPQTPGLSFDLGVQEVVAMGAYPFPSLSPAQVRTLGHDALSRVGLASHAARRYGELSGGEQQRVQFARVLVQVAAACETSGEACYLLLDEPVSSLDPRRQLELLHIAQDLARTGKVGVLAVLHDLNLAARWCDRLLLLAKGRMLAMGTPADVLTPPALEAAYGVTATVLPHPHEASRPLVLFS